MKDVSHRVGGHREQSPMACIGVDMPLSSAIPGDQRSALSAIRPGALFVDGNLPQLSRFNSYPECMRSDLPGQSNLHGGRREWFYRPRPCRRLPVDRPGNRSEPMASLQRYSDRRVLITGGGSGSARPVCCESSTRAVAWWPPTSAARARRHRGEGGRARRRLSTVVANVGDEESVGTGVDAAVDALGGPTPGQRGRDPVRRTFWTPRWPTSSRCCG